MSKIMYSLEEAAEQCSVGVTHFNARIRPHLRTVRSGRKVLIPASELERFAREQGRFPG